MQKQKNQEKIRKMKKKLFNIPDICSSESEEINEIE
jgi:hypothetical protein